MAALGDSRYRLCILQLKTSAGCDLNAIGSLGDLPGKRISTRKDIRCAARSKDAMATYSYNDHVRVLLPNPSVVDAQSLIAPRQANTVMNQVN